MPPVALRSLGRVQTKTDEKSVAQKIAFQKCVTLVRKVGGVVGVGRKSSDAITQRLVTMGDYQKPH